MALKGQVFYLSPLPLSQKTTLSSLIKKHGGDVSFTLTKKVTHVVAEEVALNDLKIKTAVQSGVQTLTPSKVHQLLAEKESSLQQIVPPTVQPNGALAQPIRRESRAPTVNLLLPDNGPIRGEYKIAVFGLNFLPSSNFHVRFGDFICRQVEFHCSSAVIATISVNHRELLPGNVAVAATNNGGKHYGPSCAFRFYDEDARFPLALQPADQKTTLLQGRLQNVRRSILQLQEGLLNVQRAELEIQKELGITVDQTSEPPLILEQPKKVSKPVQRVSKPSQPVLPKAVDPSSTLEREVRIFISSPFKDMNEDRDLFVKMVLPKLRQLCMSRDVLLSVVDLRWGVTDNQAEQAATLLMCLREIEKCDVFLGFYGERYGGCLSQGYMNGRSPTKYDELLLRSFDLASKEFSWVKDFRDRSVTEVEMRMVLSNLYSSQHPKSAWFYLRDSYYIESVPKENRHLFVSEGPYEAAKLNQLKQEIQNSDFISKTYNRPSHLAELIGEDLTNYIEQRFPKGTELSPEESDRFRHTSFALSLTRVYLFQEKSFLELDKHASSNTNTPFVVIGETGSGKSALLANWMKRYKERHVEDLVVSHWVGCSSSSTNYGNLLKRIMKEVQFQLGDFTIDIPQPPESPDAPNRNRFVGDQLPMWLEKTLTRNKRNRLILIIDGLHNLDNRENALDLLWFPRSFPSFVRVFLSLAPVGQAYQSLLQRDCEKMYMTPLDEGERIQFIRMYLTPHGKRLKESQEFRIAKCTQTGHPRFLKTLLEDMIVWGKFEELDNRIDKVLTCKSVSDLYEIVLERLENDYDKLKKGVVKHFMSLIWAARKGLYLETELSVILEHQMQVEPYEWHTLFLVVEEMLYSLSGLLNFSNVDIRKAVEKRYLQSEVEKRRVHRILADFFLKSSDGLTTRKVEELGYQLEQANDIIGLKQCISDLRMFDKLYTSDYKYDLFRFWRVVETFSSSQSSFQKEDVTVDAYTSALKQSDQFPPDVIVGDLFYRVAYFFEENAKYQGAIEVYTKARQYYEMSAQNLSVAKIDYSLGRLYSLLAKYDLAEEMFNQAKAIYVRENGENDIQVSHVYNRLGVLYGQMGKIKEAETCFNASLRIRVGLLGERDSRVGQTLKNMLSFYEELGQPEKAIECGAKALKILEETFGPQDLNIANIHVRLGRVYMALGKYAEAKASFKRSLEICSLKLGPEHPVTADTIYELGCFYFVKPEKLGKDAATWKSDKAESWFLRALKMKEDRLGSNHPDVARILNRLGTLYIERMQFVDAENNFKRALDIRIKTYGKEHSRVAQTYKSMITLYEMQEKFAEALTCGEAALAIMEKYNNLYAVAKILERLGQLHILQERERSKRPSNWNFTKAKSILNRASEIFGSLNKTQEVAEVQQIIQDLAIPPPPPPPPQITALPTGYITTEELQELKQTSSTNSRSALLNEIAEFGRKKALKQAKKTKQQAIWWQQNYAYKK